MRIRHIDRLDIRHHPLEVERRRSRDIPEDRAHPLRAVSLLGLNAGRRSPRVMRPKFISRRGAMMMVRRLEGTQPRDEITVKKIAE